jgi:parvulin-like peptidyl-prolyl isomerase
MTSRAKPVTRPRRDRLEAGERRSLLMTAGFVGVIVLALLILVAAAGAAWYGENLAPMVSVNGSTVSKDFFRKAVAVEKWRYDQQESRIRDRVSAGHLSATDADTQIQAIGTLRTNVADGTNTKIIDGLLQEQLASQRGVAVGQDGIDAAWTAEATAPEERNTFLITVVPGISEGATVSTQAEIDLAKKKADELKAKLDGGATWEDVVKEAGTGSSADGSVGWLTPAATNLDANTMKAVLALQPNAITPVVQTTDGSFDIARVTDIVPAKVDDQFAQKVSDAGLDQGVFKSLLGYEATETALTTSVLADVLDKPSDQRLTSEIALDKSGGTGDEVKSSHILISPNGDPQKASSVAATDPAWTKAKELADSIFADLNAGKITFADAAKKYSNDAGSSSTGGTLPWLTRDGVVTEFGDAIFADGLKANQILAPVKTQYGWHIIEYVDRRPPVDQLVQTVLQEASKPGADFAALARKYSDATTAAKGGEIGWVARLQLPTDQEDVIFATQPGSISPVLTTSTGYTIYKVNQATTRLPDASQASLIRGNGFGYWFTPQLAKAKVDQLATPATVLGTAATATTN